MGHRNTKKSWAILKHQPYTSLEHFSTHGRPKIKQYLYLICVNSADLKCLLESPCFIFPPVLQGWPKALVYFPTLSQENTRTWCREWKQIQEQPCTAYQWINIMKHQSSHQGQNTVRVLTEKISTPHRRVERGTDGGEWKGRVDEEV